MTGMSSGARICVAVMRCMRGRFYHTEAPGIRLRVSVFARYLKLRREWADTLNRVVTTTGD